MNGGTPPVVSWFERVRGRVMIGFVLLVGLYFVVSFGEQAWKARELEDEVAEHRDAITEIQQERDALQQQVDAYAGDEYLAYVERVARRELNLSHPGDTVMLVRWTPSTEPKPAPEERVDEPENQENWSKWVDLLFPGQ